MDHLHLVIPGLFLPAQEASGLYRGLRLPHLEKLLARSRHAEFPPAALENRLCEVFGVATVAPLRARADGLSVGQGCWLCADPVELQMQPSQVMLQPEVACTDDEAHTLCAALNAHFAGESLRFFAPHPQRWYVQAQTLGEVSMTGLNAASWQDVKTLQPQGSDARRWQRLGNEIQMLLHQHPINAARQQTGRPIINSLWLWGGGVAETIRPEIDAAGDDANLTALFARASDIVPEKELARLLTEPGKRGLWVEHGLQTAWQRGDLYACRAQLERLETAIAMPLWRAVTAGDLHSVTLEAICAGTNHRFEFKRADRWKVWRGQTSLTAYIK